MRILILEDEPLIAMDLEDVVRDALPADVCLANTLAEAVAELSQGIDFALLDIELRDPGETSLPLAQELTRRNVPYCFVSSAVDRLPSTYAQVPKVRKPFQPADITALLSPLSAQA